MTLLTILGFIGAITVLSSYFYSVTSSNPRILHWGNVFGSTLMVGGQMAAGVWYGAAVTVSFGLIGAAALYNGRKPDD